MSAPPVNNTNSTAHWSYMASAEVSLGLKIAMGLSVLLGIIPGIFGNLLVIVAITRTRLNQMVVNIFVLSLAITDVLISIFPMPLLTVYFVFYWPQWMIGNNWCRASIYVVNLCGLVSILTMTTIAVDRYFAVQRNRQLFNRTKCIITIIVIWIFGALVAITNIINGGTHREQLDDGKFDICNRISGKHISDPSTKTSLIIKLMLGLPIIIGLVIIYVRLSYTVWKRRNIPTDENIKSRSVRRAKQVKIRALHMMFAVVVGFAVCWIPYYSVTFMRVVQITQNPNINPGVVLFSYTLAMLNSTLNPMLYGLLSKRFRDGFREILTRRKSRRLKSFSGIQL